MVRRCVKSFGLWALMFMMASGCGSTGSLVRDPGQLIGRPRVERTVVRIVTLWEASQGKDPSDRPCRGFAGQILFFGPKTETGVRVRGTVVVYEYDHFDPNSLDEPQPLHSFTFEPDAWDLHRTEGTLGHSYSCFIPYMNRHMDQANCGLKVEFIGEDGRRVSSETVKVMLPGRTAKISPASRGFVREKQIGRTLTADSAAAVQDAKVSEGKSQHLESVSIAFPKR